MSSEAKRNDEFPDWIREEFRKNVSNGKVGTRLVSETDDLRVWHIHLQPGERLPVHKHVLHYFWTAVTGGLARSHVDTGETVERDYSPGDTEHFQYGPGEYMMHDLENIGDTELVFTTVEFKNSNNTPLDLNG